MCNRIASNRIRWHFCTTVPNTNQCKYVIVFLSHSHANNTHTK